MDSELLSVQFGTKPGFGLADTRESVPLRPRLTSSLCSGLFPVVCSQIGSVHIPGSVFSTFFWSEVESASDGIMNALVKEESWLAGSPVLRSAPVVPVVPVA